MGKGIVYACPNIWLLVISLISRISLGSYRAEHLWGIGKTKYRKECICLHCLHLIANTVFHFQNIVGMPELTWVGVCVGVEGAVSSHPLPSAPPMLVTLPHPNHPPAHFSSHDQSLPPKDTTLRSSHGTKPLKSVKTHWRISIHYTSLHSSQRNPL